MHESRTICVLKLMDSIQLWSNNLSGPHKPNSVKKSNSVTCFAAQAWVVPSLQTAFSHLEDVCAPLYGACLAAMCKALLQALVSMRACKVLVQLFLQWTQFTVIILCDLGGQILQYIFLHPAQQEWQCLSVQSLHGKSSCNTIIWFHLVPFISTHIRYLCLIPGISVFLLNV
jgi:hypothetical protein